MSSPLAPPGHPGHVLATLFDADGARLYSASIDGCVLVWDVASGARIESWPCHAGPILALRRSEDGARLFTASHDGSVAIWTRQGSLLHRLTGHWGGVHSLALCGRRLASGGYDGTVRLWDADSGAPLATLSEHDDAVTALAFLAPDRLASGSRDHSIRLWDLRSGSTSRALRGHRHWVTRLAALPGGRRVLSAGEDGLCILWDCERGEMLWSGECGGPIWGLALAPDGERAVTGGAVPTLCWSMREGASRSIDLPQSVRFAERSADISPDGTRVAGGNSDSGIVVYDLDRDQLIQRLPGASHAYLSATIVGERVVTGCGDGSLVLHGGGEPRRLADAHAFMAYTLCRVGPETFASGGFDRAVCIWDVRGQALARFDHGGHVFSVAASADGSRILSAGEDAVCIWSVAEQRPLVGIDELGSGFHTVGDLSPDGGFVTAGENGVVHAFKPDGALAVTRRIPRPPISALRVLPDGRRVALAEAGGAVRLLDLATGAVELLHEAHEDWIRRVHVTPDGRHIVSDSQNGICCVYDLAAHRLLEIDGLRQSISVSAVGADGEIVAITARGEILRVDPQRPGSAPRF